MHLHKKIFSFFCLFLVFANDGFSQNKSNRGKEFWLGYGFNYSFAGNTQELELYISTEQQAATVTVSVNGTGWSQTVNIPANTADATILIPKTGVNDARILTDGLSTKGIHIVSNVPVAVYAHTYANQISGSTMLMPVESYGYSYYSVNFSQFTSGSPYPFDNSPPVNDDPGSNWVSWFYVIASEDNTKVEITPSDTTKNGWLPNQTHTVTLNKGEIYNVWGKVEPTASVQWQASKDMTGSKIVSVAGTDGKCHPVAVFSGSGLIRLCRGDGGEYMQQQIFPKQAWGTRYLTYRLINRFNNFTGPILNFYRVCVADPTTVVKVNGVVLTGLINNFYYQISSTSGAYIEADKPILVSQYTPNSNGCNPPPPPPASQSHFGDPEMIYLSPIEQGQKSVVFYTTSKSAIGDGGFIYAHIIVKTIAANSLMLDGVAVDPGYIIPHPNMPGYSVAMPRIWTMDGQHSLQCDSTFTATVYGCGEYESYGYNIGCNINNLNAIKEIKNVNSNAVVDTLTCPKTPVRFYVKLAYNNATQIHWKLSQVAGMTPNTDSIINNPVPLRTEIINGRNYHVYTLQQDFSFDNIGTYKIPFSYTSPDIDACNNTEYDTITVNVVPGPKADFTFPNPICAADSVHFTSAASPNGFNLVNYLWSFDDNTNINGVNATKLFATGGPHDVRYRVYSASGCVGDTTKTINLTESPVVNLGNDISTCGNGPILLDATNTNSTYLWSTGVTTPTISVTTSGLYWVEVTKTAGGCKKRDSINIALGSFPGFDLGNNRAICEGDTLTLNATVAGAISYLWNTGATTPTIRAYQAGTYWCEVNNGCVQRDTLIITAVNSKPILNFGADVSTCAAPPILLDATNPNSTYLWQNGSTNPTLSATTSGLYWAQVTSSNGCIKRDSINIAFNSTPVFNLGADSDICNGDTLTLNATVASAISYLWNTGATTPAIKVFQPGLYWCEVNNGCIFRDSLTIGTIKPSPVVNLGNDVTVCEGITVPLDATFPNSTYLWQDGTTNPVYNVTAPGTYSVRVDLNGCQRFDTVIVNHNLKPRFNLGSDQVVCPGSPLVLKPVLNPVWQLSWQDGSTIPAFTVTDPGTYSLTATNDCGPTTDNILVIKGVCKVFMPTAFTPNNDGQNDFFKALGTETVTKFDLKIFSRWGDIIFQTTDKSKGWNGKFGGIDQASAVYIYTLQYTDLNSSQTQVLKGTFILLR